MSFSFKPAKREGAPQIIGLVGGTGSGKTLSALLLAEGLAGGKSFAVIDTEAGKAQRYAPPEGEKPRPGRMEFDFDHGDLLPPFTPAAYQEAIIAAQDKKYPVVVVDSFSHVWAGDGGVCDMHDAEVERQLQKAKAKGWSVNPEKYNWPAWNKPKREHKRMVSKLLQLRCHLILCLRAEPKTKAVKVVKNGRTYTDVVDAGWLPICEKALPFEFGTSFMLRNENPGMIRVGDVDPSQDVGYPLRLEEPLRDIFSGTFRLSREHGKLLAAWAVGKKTAETKPSKDGDPRSLKQMIQEDYVAAGVDPKAIGKALADADLKPKGKALPENTDRAEVRKVLDKLKPAKQESLPGAA